MCSIFVACLGVIYVVCAHMSVVRYGLAGVHRCVVDMCSMHMFGVWFGDGLACVCSVFV